MRDLKGARPATAAAVNGLRQDVGTVKRGVQSHKPSPRQVQARPRHAHIFELEPHGHYVEPEWYSARLFEEEFFGRPGTLLFDPACGWGRILRTAQRAGFTVSGADIVDRLDRKALGHIPFHVCDFLKYLLYPSIQVIVCNPPFDRVEEFCTRALEITTFKAAMIVPVRRLPAAHWLRLPLRTVYLMTPRPSMPPGKYTAEGNKPGGGTIDFCWLVFEQKFRGEPRMRWLHREVQS